MPTSHTASEPTSTENEEKEETRFVATFSGHPLDRDIGYILLELHLLKTKMEESAGTPLATQSTFLDPDTELDTTPEDVRMIHKSLQDSLRNSEISERQFRDLVSKIRSFSKEDGFGTDRERASVTHPLVFGTATTAQTPLHECRAITFDIPLSSLSQANDRQDEQDRQERSDQRDRQRRLAQLFRTAMFRNAAIGGLDAVHVMHEGNGNLTIHLGVDIENDDGDETACPMM